jgi:hypothetical protein
VTDSLLEGREDRQKTEQWFYIGAAVLGIIGLICMVVGLNKSETQTLREQPQAAEPRNVLSPVEQIEKLALLKDKGIVTEAEFQDKKRQLLGL